MGFGGAGAGGGLAFGEEPCGMLGNVERSTSDTQLTTQTLLGSLQPFAVNLVYAHETSDKIPVLLIRKSARLRRPDQLTR